MHDHVRENKDGIAEHNARGKEIGESGISPGCEVSSQAFARRRNEIRVAPPDWMRPRVRPVSFELDELSAGLWPYEDMWHEDGGHKTNDERREIVETFLDEVQIGKSLVFFYVDERNPLLADDGQHSSQRVLVGISRLTEIGDIREWDQPMYDGQHHMVWSVPFKHAYPIDGIRLPVHAVLDGIPDPEARRPFLVALDRVVRTDFRYGSSRISLDRSLVAVERAVSALRRFQDDPRFEQSVEGELSWLNSRLLELWGDRGPYPGVAAVLTALGCERAMEIQLRGVDRLLQAGRDPAAAILRALDDDIDACLSEFDDDLFEAGNEWSYLDEDEKQLAALIMRMELLPEQAQQVLSPELRPRHRLPLDAAKLLANPYLLSEAFAPKRDREPISFVTVDHGLLAHDSMPLLRDQRVARNDPRRVRALLTDVLSDRAADGHTFVAAHAALNAVRERSPDDRPCDVGVARLSHERMAPTIDETIERFENDGTDYVALRSVAEPEAVIRSCFQELAQRPLGEPSSIGWAALAPGTLQLSSEQQEALDRVFRSSLSVLTGAAGTGKSTLLAPLIAAVRSSEGRVAVRALTPTGKAADRLKELEVDAMTIHRALAGAGWFDWHLGRWQEESEGRVTAHTLIIDECSMVDVHLLGTLFRAVDWQGVRRLILVGDHHQLPPIGPGRPFFDLISEMTAANAGGGDLDFKARLSELTHNYRVAEGSKAIAFATGFARDPVPDEPQLWRSLGRGEDLGDLRIRFWQDPEQLHEQLLAEIDELIDRSVEGEVEPGDWRAFDATIGHGDGGGPATWQIIAPVHGHAHGTAKLNALIQDRFHGWAKRGNKDRHGVKFGPEQITSFDKVIQIANEKRRARNRHTGSWDDVPVFNGQIGVVRDVHPSVFRDASRGRPEHLNVAFTGHPDWDVSYSKSATGRYLQLAYAITVHKSQGSQFDHVFFVIPQTASTGFGRELAYTGLTRCQAGLTLFVEKDLGPLMALRKHAAAQTPRRNSRLFDVTLGSGHGYRSDGLVHLTTRGEYVRSKSEVIIGNLLHEYERVGRLSYAYEQELYAPGGDPNDLRLPDFTVRVGGKSVFWEHSGMGHDPAYMARWEEVRLPWYQRHGFADQLVVTQDGPGGTIDSLVMKRIIDERILA